MHHVSAGTGDAKSNACRAVLQRTGAQGAPVTHPLIQYKFPTRWNLPERSSSRTATDLTSAHILSPNSNSNFMHHDMSCMTRKHGPSSAHNSTELKIRSRTYPPSQTTFRMHASTTHAPGQTTRRQTTPPLPTASTKSKHRRTRLHRPLYSPPAAAPGRTPTYPPIHSTAQRRVPSVVCSC